MASIKAFKKEIDSAFKTFEGDCYLVLFAKGESVQDQVEEIYAETTDKLSELSSSIRKFEKGKAKEHFVQLRNEINELLKMQNEKLQALISEEGEK